MFRHQVSVSKFRAWGGIPEAISPGKLHSLPQSQVLGRGLEPHHHSQKEKTPQIISPCWHTINLTSFKKNLMQWGVLCTKVQTGVPSIISPKVKTAMYQSPTPPPKRSPGTFPARGNDFLKEQLPGIPRHHFLQEEKRRLVGLFIQSTRLSPSHSVRRNKCLTISCFNGKLRKNLAQDSASLTFLSTASHLTSLTPRAERDF